MLNDVYRVMAVDALASSHPLSSPADEVNTPAQISELFDTITYSKVKEVSWLLGGPEIHRVGVGRGASHREPPHSHRSGNA